MGQRQEFFKQAVLKRYKTFSYDKIKYIDLEKNDLIETITSMYHVLLGQYSEVPLGFGSWDIQTSNFIIELDEERHFNRYRIETLNSDFYKEHSFFSIPDYKRYCIEHECDCLKAAKHGKNWKNDSTERMFPKSNIEGDLCGYGSSRWRQRAYYDFLRDVASKVMNVPLFRVSIYDIFCNSTLNEILKKKDRITLDKYINCAMNQWL